MGGKVEVLVATDLAARGLDIPAIRTVVSFDVARDIETHTHRVGRTGRAGGEGDAYTLITSNNQSRKMAASLVQHFERMGVPVAKALLQLASRHPMFRATHRKGPVAAGSST